MVFLMALSALAFGVLLYAAWLILRCSRRGSRDSRASGRSSSIQRRTNPQLAHSRTRPLKRISLNEFSTVLEESSDLIVIDLRPCGERSPFPIPHAHVLSISPCELTEILEWLPPNRSAAFYGASGITMHMIETDPYISGSAPLYLLQGNRAGSEVA
jgi:hypothetical protein